ncbi:unnamed protein product [Schistosoma margrebowiei]|uniref:Uncharacterized protein n=1 Tax=Schistosoma margrebowiei TaxID=48269 RepID=A0A3P7WR70_9TREM|nr:unnamed protein product [Schistosoma margrebowiei]
MTILTFELKILTLILVDSCFESHMFFNCRNTALTLAILTVITCDHRLESSDLSIGSRTCKPV